MSLLRGYADDQPLMPWLEQHIWPAEAAHVSEDFVRDGTELAIAEMIRVGTTTFSDMYFFPDVVPQPPSAWACAARSPSRFSTSPPPGPAMPTSTSARGWQCGTTSSTASWSAWFRPARTLYRVEPNLAKVATLAAELDLAVHIHLHETAGEVLQAVEQNGERPLDSLHRLGLLGPRTQCVHMTDLGDQDIALLAQPAPTWCTARNPI